MAATARRTRALRQGCSTVVSLCVCFAVFSVACGTSATPDGPLDPEHDVHIIFSTQCTTYFDWQTLGLAYSHIQAYDKAGLAHPPLTRLMACNKCVRPDTIRQRVALHCGAKRLVL